MILLRLFVKALTIALVCCVIAPLHAQEITVAAAADLHFALDRITARFQTQSGIRVHTVYGSSGNFYQQLQNGAPFDVFLSANVDYPKKLEAAGLTVPGTFYEYARGKIVLAVPSGSKLDLKQGLRVLLSSEIKKIAIADPGHAPYGMAAVAALKTENLYDLVSQKFVTGENISQTASFVLSGAADAGIVALSLVSAHGRSPNLRFQEIPQKDYPPIQQGCVVLRSSKNRESAESFVSYLRGEDAADVFRKYGFEVPESTKR